MAREWVIERRAQHRARYPVEEARYRERHAAERTRVRRVASLLMRRSGFAIGDLAAAIRAAVGNDVAHEVGAVLVASVGRRRGPAKKCQ
jgi:hypothetical protein